MIGLKRGAARASVRSTVYSLSVVLVPVLALSACAGSAPAASPVTARVERATISTGVAAAGTITASASANLGFTAGGQLSEVHVQVGDHVATGQVLARIDDFMLRQLVTQQKANLAQQKAVLGKLIHSPVLQGAKSTLSQARAILGATRSQVSATRRADYVAISRANAGLDAAHDAESATEAALATCPTACAELASAVASAKAAVATATTAVAAAVQKQKVDSASGKVAAGTAQQGVVSAQNSERSVASDRPFNIAQQRAAVTSARSMVDIARRNLALATLKAPFEGTVTAINGTVGEYLTASTGTTAMAPGSDAAVPGTTLNAAASTIARPGGTQFMVISGSGPMTAVVPFQEIDAASIVAGQSATLAFDALPDLTVTGTVKSVAPSGTALSGTMSYFVTIELSSTDRPLKEGMTVHATIATQEKKNVLSVPDSAVQAQDGQSVVTLVDASGQQRTVSFEAGLVGPDRTEVLSGLTEGDRVVVPSSSR